jgi:hypothetical protein
MPRHDTATRSRPNARRLAVERRHDLYEAATDALITLIAIVAQEGSRECHACRDLVRQLKEHWHDL